MFSKRKNIIIDLKRESRISAIIHTFFVFFQIKVYWLDSSMQVVDYRKAKPFRIYIPKKSARYIVEIAEKKAFKQEHF